ncbi:MAG: hypothetical protein GXO87_14725 [Chlorobi bacterium]|nr:hypothetical protein [Chlorobiota bacterium]
MTQNKNYENSKAVIAFIFVLSGAAGLIYQIVWFKYLSLAVGNSTIAQMIVLATFLGGLAIGNYFFGKRADALRSPLKIYALLEIFIGLYAIIYPFIFNFFGDLFFKTAIGFSLDSGDVTFHFLRFAYSSVLLILPTIAMGGTLPLLTSYFVEKLEHTRKDVAILYFLNSFGAVVGVLLGGFLLIKAIGLEKTIYLTGTLNIVIGAGAYLIAQKFTKEKLEEESQTLETQNKNETFTKREVLVSIAVAGLSGMAALVYEMVWVRLFINIFGSSTYAFSIMLAAFISGITVGSFIAAKNFIKKFNKIEVVAFSQFFIALGTIAALYFAERLPYYMWNIASLFNRNETTFGLFLFSEFALSFLIMFVPTLFMGISLPVIVEIVAASRKKAGFSVGRVFSVNTLGTVFGVFLTGLVFIPLFGVGGSFTAGILINIFSAVLLLFVSAKTAQENRIRFSGLFVLTVFVYLFFSPSWNQNAMLSGVFKKLSSPPPPTFEAFKQSLENRDILYYKEGTAANVAVTKARDATGQKILIINGKPDASSVGDLPTQTLVAQIPLMLNPNPKKVFVVGFGSGITVHSVLTHPVEKVVCAEISEEVIEAGKYFAEENGNCLNDKRLQILVDDANAALRSSDEKYDVIVSEPSNPWIAGIGNLFSQEYFEMCKNKLNENGIMVQWYHLYESNDNIVKLVLNTFKSVFPYAQIWNGVSNDIILIGAKERPKLDLANLKAKFENPKIKNDLSKIGIDNIFTFLTTQSNSVEGFYSLTLREPVNTEIHPLLEFYAPRSFYLSQSSTVVYKNDEKFDTLFTELYAKKYWKEKKVSYDELFATAKYHFEHTRNYRFAYSIANYLAENFPHKYETEKLLADCSSHIVFQNSQKESLERLTNLYPEDKISLQKLIEIQLSEKLYRSSFINISNIDSLIDKFVSTLSKDTMAILKAYAGIAKLYIQNSDLPEAEKYCDKISSYINADEDLLKKVKLDDYYYAAAIVSYVKKDAESLFVYYLSLLNVNQNYPELHKLRGLVRARLEL